HHRTPEGVAATLFRQEATPYPGIATDVIRRQMDPVDPDRGAEIGSVLHEGTTETMLLMCGGNGRAFRAENSATYVQNSVVCPYRTVDDVSFAYLVGSFQPIELLHTHPLLARPPRRQSVADVLGRQPVRVVKFGDPPILSTSAICVRKVRRLVGSNISILRRS